MGHSRPRPSFSPLLLAETDRQALRDLDTAYFEADKTLERSSAAIGRVRALLLEQARFPAKRLPGKFLTAFLTETSNGLRENERIASAAIKDAAIRGLSVKGVVPEDYERLRAHVRAARTAIVRLLT